MHRLKPVRNNDIEKLESLRDALINKLAASTTRLRRAQSIHDRMLTQLQRTHKRIYELRVESARIAHRISGGE